MYELFETILIISGVCLVFYLIAKFGAWYEDRQQGGK